MDIPPLSVLTILKAKSLNVISEYSLKTQSLEKTKGKSVGMQNPTTVSFDILTVEKSKCWDTVLVGVLQKEGHFRMTLALIVLKYQIANCSENGLFSGLDIVETILALQVKISNI